MSGDVDSKTLSTEQWDCVVDALRTQLDEDDERHIEMCDRLIGFIREGGLLIQRCILEKGSRDVETAYLDWSSRATEYIETAMGAVFSNASRTRAIGLLTN